MASLPPRYGAYLSDHYSDFFECVEPRYYDITPPHQYQLPSTLNSYTSIVPGLNSNSTSNTLNHPYTSSDFDASQYLFSPRPTDSAPHTPSTLSEGTGNSTTPPDAGSLMSHQFVPDTYRSNDPDLQQLAEAIVNRRRSLGRESVPDLYVAQFFLIQSVSGSTRPVSNKRKRGQKPRPKKILEYHCLRCGRWDGYSKEKARQHFLVEFDMKGFTCVEPGCKHKTARPHDFTRHMELVHKQVQPKKKSGGAMRAEPPFLKLQEAYRNGERAFPVDAGQSPSRVSPTTNGLTFAMHTHPTTPQLGRIGAFSQFNALAGPDQVCLPPRTRNRNRGYKALADWLRWWHIWVTPVSAVPGIACAVVLVCALETPLTFISSVLGATIIMTVPALFK